MDKIDFKELAKDETLINKLKQFDSSIDQIKEFITNFEDPEYYDNLSNSDKIKYNLLMSFCLNSLFWMYLRTEGVNPNAHPIKGENDRLRQAMARAKQISDRSSMPRLNKDAAGRFVRSGLWEPNEKNKQDTEQPREGDIREENWETCS